jgi:hypothetical protein
MLCTISFTPKPSFLSHPENPIPTFTQILVSSSTLRLLNGDTCRHLKGASSAAAQETARFAALLAAGVSRLLFTSGTVLASGEAIRCRALACSSALAAWPLLS